MKMEARRVELTYRFALFGLPADASRIIAWVPLPRSRTSQRFEGFRVEGSRPYTIVTEPEYGNRFLCFDLSPSAPVAGGGSERKSNAAAGKNVADPAVAVFFRVTRMPYRSPDTGEDGEPASQASLVRFLAPDRLIPIDGHIAEEATRVAAGEDGPLSKARRLYDHIVSTVVYDKSGQGWGRGDALYACQVRTGNCTDFHSLFIGEARALGIPARFIMGLPLPEGRSEGEIPGYHCWAEFYLDGPGWLPVDASEASKHREKEDLFFAGLDANRIEFTLGRDVQLPGASAGPLNYVIYPYVEVDGRMHADVATHFTFRDVPCYSVRRGG